MLSFNLPFALTRLFSAPSFVGESPATAALQPAGAMQALPAAPSMLLSAYDEPPADLDQRVRASGEW
ncbi:hypothetical protein [Paracidovorax wautersii]|uniref:Uncharacterized protein n=1 Tax=Paracidovorax wautersii TaxID=1177982 RepID=A0A1I2DLF8_9BURK|nr:hypothetical protein [Paracidovorax wautersii]SFE81268.1 hypothetical protein SAMN04489711_105276 [Paracidovorax wautersii]